MAAMTSAPSEFAGKVIVLAGPPGSGKGTQSQILQDKYGLVHISTGDVFREEVRKGSELGLTVKSYLDQGCFVPDEIVINYLKDRLREPDIKTRGCILDGYPRTITQSQQLVKYVSVYRFVLLTVPNDEVLVRRAADRRVDLDTGRIYNMTSNPPPAELADVVVQRQYDNSEDAFRVRLSTYHGQVRRVLTSGCFENVLIEIDGMRPVEEVAESVYRALTEELPPVPVPVTRATLGGENDRPANEEVSKLCAVCLEKPADFLCAPCGHQCGCQNCLKTIQDTTGMCPICRTPISSVQRVFAAGVVDDSEPSAGSGGVELPAPPQSMVAVAGLPAMDEMLDPRSKPAVDEEWPEDRVEDGEAALLRAVAAAAAADDDGWGDDGAETGASGGGMSATSMEVELEIAPCADVGTTGAAGGEEEHLVVVRIKPPDVPKYRVPVDICCCVDVSASMRSPAFVEDDEGRMKANGLTVLDIVKHAVRTVAHSLTADDTVSVVTYNDKAKTIGKWQMDDLGRAELVENVNPLVATGRTNIWGGVHAAMEVLREGMDASAPGRKRSILLLTDGLPNVVPPRGHIPEIQDYKDNYPDFSFAINTFGFGYGLDSELLVDIAQEGQGTYAFIPDAPILGTTFVNCVANSLSTMAQTSTLSLSPSGGASFTGAARGKLPTDEETWGLSVSLGPILYGQEREVVVPMKIPASEEDGAAAKPYCDAVLTFAHTTRGGQAEARATARGESRKGTVASVVAELRTRVVDVGFQACADAKAAKGRKAQADVEKLSLHLEEQHKAMPSDPYLKGLYDDVSGRMSKALKGSERFNRWGKHYLRALMRSHLLQQCTNFMDPGLQLYGGNYFRSRREEGDQVFLGLDPPEPMPIPKRVLDVMNGTGSYTPPPAPAPVSMNTYYAGAGGGCFGGTSVVSVAARADEFKPRRVMDVRKGDMVLTANGPAKVLCMVKIDRDPAKTLIQVGSKGCLVTPRHPMLVNGVWRAPRDLSKVHVSNAAGYVYNMVLDAHHTPLVGGKPCLTWGHNIDDDAVRHPFLGTDRCLAALKSMPGWADGHVHIRGVYRSCQDNTVTGFRA